ncbi:MULTISPECIES: amino acid ABC transporter permease [unclassified Pseudactinotalea]|uniref:amino acid ABC transporter permease n=1 Tax=unclassified Pseudactinotalea TaxID=2649176 RepID=UPI00128BE9D8|nr:MULTISPECIES: amino acid ABC transporter permease [unclassified Pseudactinotalea]MPV48625.1 ABC transporter permease subunit [Pseudactinotalea sp. HY160]QGH68600.1 ABC transporter permease subunit [Pseudactinotalea sp. HY158]
MGVLIEHYVPTLASALWLTLRITGISFAGALAAGTILAVFRISPIPPLRAVGSVYVEIFRNVPLVALVVLVVYGLPDIGFNPGFLPGVILATTAVGTAFACETLRTGINTVGAGQVEAARAIGLSFLGIMRHLVVPQAARSVVGPLVTLFIGILLSSSMAAVVGQPDLTYTASLINSKEALGLVTFGVVAVIYAVISLLAAGIGSRVEARVQVLR